MNSFRKFMRYVVNPIGLIIFIVLILGMMADYLSETTTDTVDITVYPQTTEGDVNVR